MVQERTGLRDLIFSAWIRSHLPDPATGFMVSDIDFCLQNYKTKKVMLLEIKCRNVEPTKWQRNFFQNIHTWILNGIGATPGWQYLGCHLIMFSGEDFETGTCRFDKVLITEAELVKKLSF